MTPKLPVSAKIAVVGCLLVFLYSFGWVLYFQLTRPRSYAISNIGVHDIQYMLIFALNISGIITGISCLLGNKKVIKWLRFLSCSYFFALCLTMFLFLLRYLVFISIGNTVEIPWQFLIISFLELSIFCYSTIILGRFFEVFPEQVSISGELIQSNAILTKAGRRFFNRLIDYLVLLFFLIPQLDFFRPINKKWSIYATEIIIVFLYYLVTECIFKTTPAKILTGCTVIDAKGSRPGFFTMLGRTFCRFIPFDAFSYLGKDTRGWHDSIPNVFVVEEKIKMDEVQADHSIEN